MFKVVFTKLAHKQFSKLPQNLKLLATKSINKLSTHPKIGKPLRGKLKGFYKLRFSRYRIIYQIKHKILTIIIFEIGHRKDVYKKFNY